MLSQRDYELEQVKRSFDDSNRVKDAKISELEERLTNMAVESERLR